MPTFSQILLHSTVRIECANANGTTSAGTGFFYSMFQTDQMNTPVIITNKHVIKDAVSYSFDISTGDTRAFIPNYGRHQKVKIQSSTHKWILHPDINIDLAALPCGDILNNIVNKGLEPFYAPIRKQYIYSDSKLKALSALENITMIGYPNGLWDVANNLPIMRRGVTATPVYVDYLGKREFIIDAACFGGSSGSPVFILDEGSYSRNGGVIIGSRLILIGILHAGPQISTQGIIKIVDIPTALTAVPTTPTMMNLGYCIKASEIEGLEDHMLRLGFPTPVGYIHKPVQS